MDPKHGDKESNLPHEPKRFAYEGLQRVIHERARLGILSSLVSHPQGLVFNDLKLLVGLTDGNLSRQLTLLADGGFVQIWKGMHKNRPQTLVRLTDEGRRKFAEYVSELERVVADAATVAREGAPAPAARGRRPGGLSPA
jgi:DNA-binding MarR family transcriptional regulator